MALIVGTNSWVTLAEANTYFETRIKSEGWDNLTTDAEKESYLVTAYKWIFNDPYFTAPASADNIAVKDGQCEAALFLIDNYDEYEQRGALIASGVKDFTFSKWSETLGEQTKPKIVIDYFDNIGYYQEGCVAVLAVDDSTLT